MVEYRAGGEGLTQVIEAVFPQRPSKALRGFVVATFDPVGRGHRRGGFAR